MASEDGADGHEAPIGQGQGQVYVSDWPKRLLTSPLIPGPLLRAALGGAARLMRLRIARRDRAEAAREPPARGDETPTLWFADIYHGGETFWDWIILRGGGLWWSALWPLVVRTSVERLRLYPEARTVLELDAHTYEQLSGRSASEVEALRGALADGRMEIVNGTYAQPLAPTVGAEANLRHFFYGLATIEDVLGVEVRSFVAGEPQFIPQLPQILRDCAIENVVLRTHWAPFGTDPRADADVVRWRGPDGSEVRTVPRYSFMDYELQKREHPGVQNAGLTGDDFERWTTEERRRFEEEARRRGIRHPLVTRLADPKPPESPFPGLVAAARSRGARLVTIREYCEMAHENEPCVTYTVDDIPTTLPWGLGGEALHREQTATETALLTAERLDAVVQALRHPGEQERLDAAWKQLMRAQHHDLHLCAPWHSARHHASMGELGYRLARRGREEAEEITERALRALAERVGDLGSLESGVLLFNPSPWPRRELVELEVGHDETEVVWHGFRVDAQVRYDRHANPFVAFVVDLPPLGFDIVALRPDMRSQEEWEEEREPEELDPDEDPIAREAGSRSIRGGYLTVWSNGRLERSRIDRILLQQNGSVYRRYQVEGSLLGIPFYQSLTAVPALNRIDLATELVFRDGEHLGPQLADHRAELAYYIQDDRKLCLNLESEFSRLFCDSPFWIAEPEGPRVTAGSFLGLEGSEGGRVTIQHRGTPGWHVDADTGLALNVLAWGPEQWLYASEDSMTPGRSRYTALRGAHEYSHRIAFPASRLEALRSAHDFRLPVLTVRVGVPMEGFQGPWSFLDIEPQTVFLTALFARDGETFARLWNASDEPVETSLVGHHVGETEVSLRLREQTGSGWPTLRPWGIQTVRLDNLGATV